MEIQMELQQWFYLLGNDILHGQRQSIPWCIYITWETRKYSYYLVLLHGQVILWKLLYGHRHLASCFFAFVCCLGF